MQLDAMMSQEASIGSITLYAFCNTPAPPDVNFYQKPNFLEIHNQFVGSIPT